MAQICQSLQIVVNIQSNRMSVKMRMLFVLCYFCSDSHKMFINSKVSNPKLRTFTKAIRTLNTNIKCIFIKIKLSLFSINWKPKPLNPWSNFSFLNFNFTYVTIGQKTESLALHSNHFRRLYNDTKHKLVVNWLYKTPSQHLRLQCVLFRACLVKLIVIKKSLQ